MLKILVALALMVMLAVAYFFGEKGFLTVAGVVVGIVIGETLDFGVTYEARRRARPDEDEDEAPARRR